MIGCTFSPELFTRRARRRNNVLEGGDNSKLQGAVSSSTEEQRHSQEDDSSSGNRSRNNNSFLAPSSYQSGSISSEDSVYRHHVRTGRVSSQAISTGHRVPSRAVRDSINNNNSGRNSGCSRVPYPGLIESRGGSRSSVETPVPMATGGQEKRQRRPAPLPQGWSMFTAPEGRQYFHNEVTGLVQWEWPRAQDHRYRSTS